MKEKNLGEFKGMLTLYICGFEMFEKHFCVNYENSEYKSNTIKMSIFIDMWYPL